MIGRDNQNFIFTPQHLYSQGSHLNKPQPKYVYSHNLYTHNVYLYISLIQFYMFCFILVSNMRRYCILMCVGRWYLGKLVNSSLADLAVRAAPVFSSHLSCTQQARFGQDWQLGQVLDTFYLFYRSNPYYTQFCLLNLLGYRFTRLTSTIFASKNRSCF